MTDIANSNKLFLIQVSTAHHYKLIKDNNSSIIQEFQGLFLHFVHKMCWFCASNIYLPKIYPNIFICIFSCAWYRFYFWKHTSENYCYKITLMCYIFPQVLLHVGCASYYCEMVTKYTNHITITRPIHYHRAREII